MPYWEKPEVEIEVSDDELLRHEIDDVTEQIREYENSLNLLNEYRNELIEKGVDAVREKELTKMMMKYSKENWERWKKLYEFN